MRISSINQIDKIYRSKQASVDTMELLGFEFQENLFADSSGFGQDNEPALTTSQLEREVKRLLQEHGSITTKITSVGMFQVNIGVFTKTGKKRAKTIASNCYLIDDGNGKRRVRLYDTDIITENGDGTITLNTGGFNTMTTSKRMNEFSSAHVYRKNWEMYANGTKFNDDNTVTVDG